VSLLEHVGAGRSRRHLLRLAHTPSMVSTGSISTTSASNALSTARLSMLTDTGIATISLYPLAAAMNASPMPVLPPVGSIRTL
jgi:hypothetical protein